MKSIELRNPQGNPPGQPFNLSQVKQGFIVEFHLPRYEIQPLSELQEIKQRDGDHPWQHNQ